MRAFMFAAIMAMLAGDAMAQSSPQDLDRLRSLLDDRLGSGKRTRSVARPQQPKVLKPDDFYVVRPDGTVRANDKRSSMSNPAGVLLAEAAGWAGYPALAADASDIVLAQADGRARSAPQIKRDSYVVQLKDDLTSAELDDAIDTLRNKYGLEITNHNNTLGLLYVSPARNNRRGVAAAPSSEPRTLGAALEPQIIKDLRREPFVDAAYVNFAIGPKSLPRRSDTKVQAGPATFSWDWRTGGTNDGNWGLKAIRMPPVWTILDRARKANPDRSTAASAPMGTSLTMMSSAACPPARCSPTANTATAPT